MVKNLQEVSSALEGFGAGEGAGEEGDSGSEKPADTY